MTKHRSGLTVAFAGLNLPSPIIAASAPPTESAKAMIACAQAGAGAVITKSVVDYDRLDWPDIPRRVRRDARGLWIQGSFSSETLPLTEGLRVVRDARDSIAIPIIASVGVLDPNDDSTLETALRLIEAGADMIHLDLFYLPQPRSNDSTIDALRALFRRAKHLLPVPVAPKLNIDIPAHRFAEAYTSEDVDGVFLLDSVRVPPSLTADGEPSISAWHGGLECSLFGKWQKPITLQYTRVLSDAGMPAICAGGGLQNADDILEAIMLGATCAQVATQIIIHGYDWIRRSNDQLAELLAARSTSIVEARGMASDLRDRKAPEFVTPVRAVVDANRCQPCGVCTTLVFCPFISSGQTGMPIIDDACYGCGLCEAVCPHPGAIHMEPTP